MHLRLLAALIVLLPWALPAFPATISGLVDVRREPPADESRPNLASVGAPPTPARADRRRSVVYLEVAPQAAFDLPERPAALLDQREESFQPYVVAVTVGSTVEFPNNDNVFHNVFSLSKAKRFDLGRYPRGGSKSVRFEHPGVVRVFCEIHSHMNAFILVFAHPYFAVTGPDGRYRIERVPAGDYDLTVWNDGEARETRKLHVPAGGVTPDEDFLVR